MNNAHGVLYGDELCGSMGGVAFRSAEAWKQEDVPFGRNQVCSVWFGSDVNGKTDSSKRLSGCIGVRGCREEVPPHRHQHIDLALPHRMNCIDNIEAMLAGDGHARSGFEPVKEALARCFPDANRPVPLHV